MGIPNRKYFSVKRRRGESPVSQTPLENPENPLNPDGSGGGALPHNSTTGKQGGDPVNDFYGHVTEDQLDGLIQLLSPPDIDQISQVGTISFVSPTELNALDWKAIFSGVELDTTPLNISGIEGTPTDYARGDALYYKPDGTLGYSVGYEDPEGTPLPPAIPDGTLRMADILRTPTGVNVIDYVTEQLSDFVSKSDTSLQTLESFLGFKKMIADDINKTAPIRSAIFNQNGRLSAPSSPTIVDVFTTQQGATNYSKLLTIDATVQNTRRYKVPIEISGVNGMEGQVWTQIEIDVNGDMVTNTLLTFGNVDPTRFKLVKVGAKVYELYVSHTETDDFFKYRPKFSFGSNDKYTYSHLLNRVALPAGDQYSFQKFIESPFTVNETEAIQNGDSPSSGNPFITVSALNSYAYVQEAPINGNHYARKDGVWTAFTPFVVAGTATDGHVVTSVAGVPTWVAPSGGGGGLWTEGSGFIYRASPVVINLTSVPSGAQFAIKGITNDLAPRIFQVLSTTDAQILGVSGGIGGTRGAVYVNGHTGVFSGLGVKGNSYDTYQVLFDVQNSLNESLITCYGRHRIAFGYRVEIGLPTTGLNQYGPTIRANTNDWAKLIVRMQNGYNQNMFDLYHSGQMHVGAPSSPINTGMHFKGRSNSGAIFCIDNAANTRRFQLDGTGDLTLSGVLARTSDPLIAGMLWNDSGTVKISAG